MDNLKKFNLWNRATTTLYDCRGAIGNRISKNRKQLSDNGVPVRTCGTPDYYRW
jgi:hypothetical protein